MGQACHGHGTLASLEYSNKLIMLNTSEYHAVLLVILGVKTGIIMDYPKIQVKWHATIVNTFSFLLSLYLYFLEDVYVGYIYIYIYMQMATPRDTFVWFKCNKIVNGRGNVTYSGTKLN